MKAARLLGRRLLLGLGVPSIVVLVALLSGPTELEPADPEGLHARPPFVNLCRRALHLTVTLTPVACMAPAALVWPSLQPTLEASIVSALERSGAAFIKWGQWASTRPDLLPRKLCDALSVLHSGAPAHSFELTRAEVSRAVGAPLAEYFESFEAEPIASGSIGQVHLARLGGRAVAVKVRHPGVQLELQTDFYIMSWAAWAVQRLPGLGWLDAQSTVRQFASTLVAQVDLEEEGRNLRQMRHNFAGWRDVRFPKLLLATRAVLIEAHAEGLPVTRYTLAGGRALLTAAQRHLIVRRGLEIYLKMLLLDNLMHADMHPGNILFDARHNRIQMVDLGLVATLTADERRNFIGFLQALGNGDGRAAARCVLGWSANQACADDACVGGFEDGMGRMFDQICRGYGTGIHLGNVLRGTLDLVRRYRVTIGANYMTLVVNALCLEGMARELEPEYNVMDAAKPLLSTYGRMPRPVFLALLPLMQVAKAAHDHGVDRQLEKRERADRGSLASPPVALAGP